MFRMATPADANTVTALGVAAGLFPADDTAVTDTMMMGSDNHWNSKPG